MINLRSRSPSNLMAFSEGSIMRGKVYIGVTLVLIAAAVTCVLVANADAQPGREFENRPSLVVGNSYKFTTAFGAVTEGRLDEQPSGDWIKLVKYRISGPNTVSWVNLKYIAFVQEEVFQRFPPVEAINVGPTQVIKFDPK